METPEQSRRTRRIGLPRRWPTRIALGLVVLGAFAVPVAWASHQFTDVPNSNPHHDDISAIFGARITTGCTPTQYCPGNPVLRQEMASFLRRGLGRNGASGTAADLALTANFQDLAVDTMTAGGATGGSAFVIVMGGFTTWADNGLPSAHRIEFRLVRDGSSPSGERWTTLYPSGAAFPSASAFHQWVFSVPTGTTSTFRLQARVAFGAYPGVFARNRLIQLLYVPFGSSGTSSLSETLVGSSSATPSGEGK